mmetsp:Transcript_118021/g.252066  ORF Transcript_118021/g.252066 Transcript_118021/m.252066 type:complete len:694 (-) Transcript_118021:302-2383(-)
MCAATELDAVLHAPGGGLVLQEHVDLRSHTDHANRVGVRLPEDGPKAINVHGLFQLDLSAVHLVSLLHLLVDDLLDAPHLVGLNGLVVGEIEAQLALVDERALLVDLVTKDLPQRIVEYVRGSVVLRHHGAARVVYLDRDLITNLKVALGLHGANVKDVACVLLGIVDGELDTRRGPNVRLVEGLPALLSIARRPVKDQAYHVGAAVAALDEVLAIVDRQNFGRGLIAVTLRVPLVLRALIGRLEAHALDELVRLVRPKRHVLGIHLVLCLLGLLPEVVHGFREARHVDLDAMLLSHELGEVNGETVGGVEQKGVLATDLALLGVGLELADTPVKRPSELLLLLLNDSLDVSGILLQRREGITEGIKDRTHELVEEPRRCIEDLAAVAHCPAQDATKDVAASLVRRRRAIGQSDGQRADVIGNDTIGHVHMVLVFVAHLAGVFLLRAGLLLDGFEDCLEQIRVVVAPDVQEHRRNALKAHARIDALRWQIDEAAIFLALVLHENIVPDFEHIRVVHVDQSSRIAATDAVVVDLRARTARARFAHFPEVVLHVEGQDPRIRQIPLPDLFSLLVHWDVGLLLVPAVISRIQAAWVQVVDLCQKLPSPSDSLLLEIVTERPISEHLEEGVVVDILAHVLEVVVFASGTDALLRVRCALQLRKGVRRVDLPNKDGLELVHASVDEEKGGIVVRHHRR